MRWPAAAKAICAGARSDLGTSKRVFGVQKIIYGTAELSAARPSGKVGGSEFSVHVA
jgi:hypothetical protein